MKLVKNFSGILILVLIALNIFVSSCEKIQFSKSKKLTRNKYQKKSFYKARVNIIRTILDKLEKALKDPQNVIFFSLGVTSEFVADAEKAYKEIKDIIGTFSPCYSVISKAYEAYKLNESENEIKNLASNTSMKLVEENLNKQLDKKEYCQNIQKEIHKTFIDATFEQEPKNDGIYGALVKFTPDSLLDISYTIASKVVDNEEFCGRPIWGNCPILQAQLIKKFNNLDEYYKECKFFSSLDCNVFSPEKIDTSLWTEIWVFIKKAYSYYKLVKTTAKCMNNLFKESKDDKLKNAKIANKIFNEEEIIKNALATTIGIITNILTFGTWGGIQGGYYIVDLALKIKEFYDKFSEDLEFKIGKLVGKAIAIAKGFVGLRRKLRKFK